MKKQWLTLTICGVVLLASAGNLLAKQPPANGKYIDYFPDGKRIHEITWRKDEQVLRRKVYHDNGRLYRDVVYRDGEEIVEKVYYKNGRLKSFWTKESQKLTEYTVDGRYNRTISTKINEKFSPKASRTRHGLPLQDGK